jgi:AraC family transcriptional regulator of arabinose operon
LQEDFCAMPANLVTGHAFDKKEDAVWNESGLELWSLTYTLEGAARFPYRGGVCLAQAGDIVLHRPYALYAMEVMPPHSVWENLWANFTPRSEWYQWLQWPEVGPGLMKLTLRDSDLRAKVVQRFEDVHRLATSALRMREIFAMNALEEALLWCEMQNPNSEQSPWDPRIQRVMDYLCYNLTEKLTLDALACLSGLSVSGLSHLFRRQVGMTLQQYQEAQRLERAKRLLELTNRRIQVIAAAVGFENPFYFSLRFRQHVGISPRDYRRQWTERGEDASETGKEAAP